ncbi:DUF1850 domain-containing protein [Peribacillus alkalitolerans]|uniref:DUF1850 domain-containing protein n=1 Tax=Peribacillus alkalitolerans TaxID=1550385 RepID=UPI0013D2D847|nr:DUF1850 domain-containing protein [Peribacillus alkalitolerans]
MKHYLNKKHISLFISLILLILLVFFTPYKKALVFEFQNTRRVLAYIPLKGEQKFQIKYTHSIHLTDVVESYRINPNQQIQQYELMYEDFAIGMPSDAGKGEVFEIREGKYFIKNMKRIFPFFDLRIGKVRANHTVIYKGEQYPLSSYIQPGTRVRVKEKTLNIVQQLRGVNILER